MNAVNDNTGIAGLVLKREEQEHYIVKRFMAALTEERDTLRVQNDHPTDIATTTLLRGELRILKRILARLEEVGPESRASELPLQPESSPPASTAGGFPVRFER